MDETFTARQSKSLIQENIIRAFNKKDTIHLTKGILLIEHIANVSFLKDFDCMAVNVSCVVCPCQYEFQGPES